MALLRRPKIVKAASPLQLARQGAKVGTIKLREEQIRIAHAEKAKAPDLLQQLIDRKNKIDKLSER